MKHEKLWYFLALFGHGNLLLTVIIAFMIRLMYNVGLASSTMNSIGTGLAMYGVACYGAALTVAFFLDKHEEKDKRKEVK